MRYHDTRFNKYIDGDSAGAIADSPEVACHKRKPHRHEYLSRSAFANIRVLGTDFTALRLGAHVGVLLLPLPCQFG